MTRTTAILTHAAVVMAFFLLLLPTGAAGAEEAAHPGPAVTHVQVEGLSSMDEAELLYLLDVQVGRPLEPTALRHGIKRAFLKGLFEDISVEADGGTVLVRVVERDIINKIDIKGVFGVSRKFVRKHMGLAEGDVLRRDRLREYRDRVLAAVREAGYAEAALTLSVVQGRKPYRVGLLLEFRMGSPLRVRSIEVLGRPHSEVVRYIPMAPGSVYDQIKLRRALQRLEKRYKKRGYLRPVVGPYTYSAGELRINVNPGIRLGINIKGNDSVRDKTLLRVMPFFAAGDIRDDLVDEAVSKMLAVYHARGYPEAQVAPVRSAEGEEVTLNFYVYEGMRVHIRQINLIGLSVPEANLKNILTMREGEFYNPDTLEADVRTIRDFYNALGYLHASVSEPEVTVLDRMATVTVHVEEGNMVTLSDISVSGLRSMAEDDVMIAIGLRPGEPYNEVDISDARRRVLGLYRRNGHIHATVDVQREFDDSGGADVRFVVNEAEAVRFGKTLITGNRTTQSRVIKRELLHLEGEPLNKDLLLKARQKIYKVGLFSEVDVDLLKEREGKADVVVKVTEGRAGTVEFGLGYGEYDLYRGFVDLSYNNFFGMNRKMSFRTELSSLLTRYIVNYRDPWFMNSPIPFRAYLIREDRKEKNIDTGDIKYRVQRYTAGVGIEKQMTERIRLDLLYEFSHAKTSDVSPDIILSREDTGTLAISSITPSMSYDSRDNPFDPQRGLFAGVSFKVASYLLGSQTDFIKAFAFGSAYYSLSKRVVFATALRGGLAVGQRETEELPLVERFFLGGRNTVRGYGQDTLGPKSPLGTPTGGNVFVLSNMELRVRVAGNWRVVLFLDSGAVWLDRAALDLDDLRYTAGLGIQYNTPIGPIRLDYGRKLNKESGEEDGAIHFSIGHAF